MSDWTLIAPWVPVFLFSLIVSSLGEEHITLLPIVSPVSEFLAIPRNITVLEGHPAVLRCKTKDIVHNCQWFYLKFGLDMFNSGSKPILVKEFRPTKNKDCSIKFSKTRMIQAGQWICKGLQIHARKYVISRPAFLQVISSEGGSTVQDQNEPEDPEENMEHIHKESNNTEVKLQYNLTIAILREGIAKITEALELFSENDPDWDRSSTVKRNVLNSISCYREILQEKEQASQSILDAFFKRQPIAPKEEDAQLAAPKEEDAQLAAPKEEDAQPAAPKEEDAQPAAPKEEDAQPAAPEKEDAQPAAPEKEDAQPAASEKEDAQPAAPEKEDAQPAAPKEECLMSTTKTQV